MIKRIDEKDLPDLPEGWWWVGSKAVDEQPCWDASSPDGWVDVHEEGYIDVNRAPLEVIALVRFANGIGPDPRPVNERPTSDNRARAIALLEAAIALLEES